MSRSIRSSLALLAGGALFARTTAFLASLLLATRLGRGGFGDYAAAVQGGAVLGYLFHSGIHAVAQRETATSPANAGGWIRGSIRARLAASAIAYPIYCAIVPFTGADLTLLLLAGLLVFPAAFDLKGLADAAGRTRLEVALEAVAGVVHLAVIALLVATDRVSPGWLVSGWLVSRCVYAAGVARYLGEMGPVTEVPSIRRLVLSSGGPLSAAYAADRLTASSDVILIRLLAGSGAAGLYAVAEKLAQAVNVPVSLLGRTLSPHIQASVPRGDARATLERCVRASAYAVLPLAAGGWVVADDLIVRVYGAEYAGGGWTLRWLLVSAAVAGVGWRFADMLFAHRCLRQYVIPLLLAVAVNWCVSLALIPGHGSAGSTLGTAASQCAAMPLAWLFLRMRLEFSVVRPLLPPITVAAATAAAAWAVPREWGTFAGVAAGGVVCIASVAVLELRRGWSALGVGIEAASGFHDRR